MARPRKKEIEKLNKVLPIRCSQSDYLDIKSKADKAHQSLSEFVRNSALGSHIIVQDNKASFELVQELRKSGNNLNQLTKRFNSTGIEPVELRRALETHDRLLQKVLSVL